MTKLPRGLTRTKEGRFRIQFASQHTKPSEMYRERLPSGTTRRQAEQYLAKLREDDRNMRLLWPSEKRAAAERAASSVLGDFVAQHYLPHIQAHNAPSTVETKCYHLQTLGGWFLDTPLDDIDTAVLVRYQHERKQEPSQSGDPIKDRTVNGEVTTLRHVLTYAHELGLRKQPAPKVRPLPENDAKQQFALTMEQAEECLGYARARSYLYYAGTWILLATGLRWSEFSQLRWDDIDLEGRLLHVRADLAKNGEARSIPLKEEDVHVVQLLPREHELVFAKRWGGVWRPWSSPRIRAKTLPRGCYYPWEEPVPHGAYHFGPHVFRHTCCTWLLQSGVPPQHVQKLMGHKDIAMTLRVYNHIVSQDMRSEVERVERPQPQSIRLVGEG